MKKGYRFKTWGVSLFVKVQTVVKDKQDVLYKLEVTYKSPLELN